MSKNEVWGMAWDKVESQSMDGPAVGKYTFQLIDAKRGVNRKGKPYVNVACKVVKANDKAQVGKVHYEYLSLEPERLGFTKAFFEAIGAGFCLRQNKGPGDAVGAVFAGSVVSTTSDSGQEYRNLRNLEPVVKVDLDDDDDDDDDDVDDDGVVEPDDDDEDDDEPPAKTRRPAPMKSQVGRKR